MEENHVRPASWNPETKGIDSVAVSTIKEFESGGVALLGQAQRLAFDERTLVRLHWM